MKTAPSKTALSKKYRNITLSKKYISRKHSKIAPSKNVFQKDMSNYHLKNAFQNCYKLSIGNKKKNPVGLTTLDWTYKYGNLDEKLYYTDQLHLIEAGNRKFACSILKILSKLMQDFNIKDHDFPLLSCNMSVRNFLPSSDRSCKLVCVNYVCKSKPVTTSNVRKCKLITVSNTRTSKPIRESKPVSTNASNSTPLIVSCSVSKSKLVRSCPVRTNKPVVSSNVHPCKRVRTSNICKSKPVSTNVSNSTSSIGSCSVSKSKPVHSCPIRTNEPVVSGNFRPCKRVRTSNTCKHKSRNHSSKYKINYLSLFLFFSADFLEFLLLGIFVNNNFNFL